MSKAPKVSILTVTYNHENYIRQALDSFIMQKTDFVFEVIVSDDHSSDGTPEIIKEYAEKYPQIIRPVLRQKNIGMQKNFIEVLRAAKGDYIALCEGDDYWTDLNKLQIQADYLDKNLEYSLCFHPVSVLFENNEEKESVWPNITNKTKINTKELLKENFIPTDSVMYRKQNYEHVPSNIMPMDWYLHVYHAHFGKIGFINRNMSVYRRHSEGMWWDSHANKDKFWQKYGLLHTALFAEFLKLYNDDPELKSVISGSLSNAVMEMTDFESRHQEGLLKQIVKLYPEIPEIFMINSYYLRQKLNKELDSKQGQIDRLNQDVLSLRSNIFELRTELHDLRNSRFLGKIIKARSIVGDARKDIKHAPHKVLHKTRVIVAPAIPGPARRTIKRVYKKGRQLISERLQEKTYEHKAIKNVARAKNTPLVSVVTAYYNAAETIDETLNSLKNQTFKNFEVIIVNDGSTDPASIRKINNLNKEELKLTVIDQKNQGPAIARNNGIKNSRGKYIICLDSDDMLEPTFIEKNTLLLEANPDVSVVTTHKDMFGVVNEEYKNHSYDPIELYTNNMVICAAEFRKEAWVKSGGYKPNIGYEDWEYWLNLSEHGFWGKLIPEVLFKYRTSLSSRFVEDKDVHWNNIKKIRSLHPNYKKTIKKLKAEKDLIYVSEPETALINMCDQKDYSQTDNGRKNVLITVPWMTFGGAETLIYNYCREIKGKFNITFATGLMSEHEWEWKFKEITLNIYHLANLFDDSKLYLEFISNYITTRKIDVLHIIHNGFMFEMLPEIKRRYPDLKIIVTLFNDRVEYFEQTVASQDYIDIFTTDNIKVAEHFKKSQIASKPVSVIPNGIDCYHEFSPELFDRKAQREFLGINENDKAIFFVGRLSEEKNPDVFVATASQLLENKPSGGIKFFVIGDGPMRSEIENSIRKVGNNNLQYLGYQTEIAKYLSAADIFILPSSIEGFPLSILEAMAMRVVVIASDVGAVAEVVESGKEGFVVPQGSVTDIVKAVTELVNDNKKLVSFKENARLKVEKQYSNRILGDNYTKLYKGL